MFNLVHDYMKKLCHLPMFVVTQVFHLPEGLPREMARCAQIQRQVHATQRSYSHTFEPDPNQFGLATSHRILAFFCFSQVFAVRCVLPIDKAIEQHDAFRCEACCHIHLQATLIRPVL